MDPAELLNRYFACEDHLLSQIWEWWFPRLAAWFRRQGFSAERAEDLAAVTLTKLALYPKGRWDPEKRGPAFVWTIARNEATNARRHDGRRIREDDTASAQLDLAAGREPPPTDHLTAQELQQAVDEELARLPAHYRTVILLKLEGRSNGEIAEILGISYQIVANRHHRGNELLKERLRQRGFDID
jgi:RNA polymerase sigma factor (sigma-70 family)